MQAVSDQDTRVNSFLLEEENLRVLTHLHKCRTYQAVTRTMISERFWADGDVNESNEQESRTSDDGARRSAERCSAAATVHWKWGTERGGGIKSDLNGRGERECTGAACFRREEKGGADYQIMQIRFSEPAGRSSCMAPHQ